jgi:hypothetical protein
MLRRGLPGVRTCAFIFLSRHELRGAMFIIVVRDSWPSIAPPMRKHGLGATGFRSAKFCRSRNLASSLDAGIARTRIVHGPF